MNKHPEKSTTNAQPERRSPLKAIVVTPKFSSPEEENVWQDSAAVDNSKEMLEMLPDLNHIHKLIRDSDSQEQSSCQSSGKRGAKELGQ